MMAAPPAHPGAKIKELDSRLRGNDEFIEVPLNI